MMKLAKETKSKEKKVAVIEAQHSSSESEYAPDEEEIIEAEASAGHTSWKEAPNPPNADTYESIDEGVLKKMSLLESFNNHITKSIWNKNPDRPPLKCISHSRKMTQWKIDDEAGEVVERVKKSGLYGIAKHYFRWIDYVAISAFVERWHPETNTFHMPFGEMTITLDDVYHILHVPIVGKSIYKKNGGKDISLDDAVNLLVHTSIDESEAKSELNGTHSIKLDWVRSKFRGKSMQEDALDVDFDNVARAYLFHLLGCVTFTDKSGTKFSVHYLNALKEIEKLDEQAWGMAILAYLYRQLGLASRKQSKQISGCLTLLLAWIYDHFPNMVSTGVPNPNYLSTQPRMCKWQTTQQGAEATSAIIRLREKLDDLTERDVIWDPYKNERNSYPLHEYVFYNGIMVCFDIAEPYYPDRVLRQFWIVQCIPKDPMKPKKYRRGEFPNQYKIEFDNCYWYGENWKNHVLNPELCAMEVTKPWECTEKYKSWYIENSHPIVQNPNSRKHLPGKKIDANILIEAAEKSIETLNEVLYDSEEDDVNIFRGKMVQAKGLLLHALVECGQSSYIKRVEEIRSKKRNEDASSKRSKAPESVVKRKRMKKVGTKKKEIV